MTQSELDPGLSGSAVLDVTGADTAIALGSGDVAVLGTPRLVALAEEATCAAVASQLVATETTVGVRVEFDHTKATPVGDRVTAEALLSHVDGRRLVFDVAVRDRGGQVASGKVTRVVVDRTAFPS